MQERRRVPVRHQEGKREVGAAPSQPAPELPEAGAGIGQATGQVSGFVLSCLFTPPRGRGRGRAAGNGTARAAVAAAPK